MSRFGPSRGVLAALVLAIAALVVGGGSFYLAQRQALRREAEADLLTIAALKVDQIVAWRAERLGDAAVLMDDPFVLAAARHWLAAPSDEIREQLLARLRSMQEHYRYSEIQLVDDTGQVRLSVSGREDHAAHPQVLDMLATAWREHRPMLVDLHVPGPGLPPCIDAISPFDTVEGGVARPAGAFILQSDARQFLYPLIQSWPRPSASAETLLVRRDGDHVLFLNELRHQPHTALILRIPLSQSDLPAVMAIRGRRGIVQGVDYRGVRVFAALEPVPNSPWFMVAKVDRKEALAVWYRRSILIVALLLGLAAVAVAGVGVVWKHRQKEQYQALFEAESALRTEEARHRATLMSVGEGVIVADAGGGVQLMNPAAERLTGWSSEMAVGRPLAEVLILVDEATRQPMPELTDALLRQDGSAAGGDRRILLSRDGGEVAVALSPSPINDERGGGTGIAIVIRDQTAERLARRLTETRLSLIEFAADHTLEELLVRAVDDVAGFVESPIGFYHFVEGDQKTISLQQWSTRTVREFCTAEGRGLHYDVDKAGVWVDCVRFRKPVVHNDYEALPNKRGLPDGHARVIRELVAPVMRDDKVVAILGVGNKPSGYNQSDVEIVSYLADVTWQIVEQKRAEEIITRMAYHDSLTDLPNRLLFDDRLNVALPRARRNGEHLALMVLDLDSFKEVNDTWGHAVGDRLLQLAAERLTSVLRKSDTVARIGGDEFYLLLPDLAGDTDAVAAAEKVVAAFEQDFEVDGTLLRVTASVGLALFPEDSTEGEGLMKKADRAMYRAKRAGRSNFRRYSEAEPGDSFA